ncbi:Fidipidine, putative isoform 2 [Hibiscus syriacus]|uniref:Fidipidine, putative isoform 2 n=1 Tax=Hibiscus syriacus TaxID=106335 RepID=A0A6A2Y1V3_HIBSY|nr:Fidipidine, putative isoform 2 [Hibiscus syriacus]
MEVEVSDLEGKLATGSDSNMPPNSLDDSLNRSLEELNLAKRELTARLRAIVSIKRQLDNAPSQSELIQYEHRFSELSAHIQLQQTRKLYATYNALLEIKDLILKETSLLNSINSQFQDAIAGPIGRMKLLESMEGIVKGRQQKLDKAQIGLQEELKI